MQESLSLRFSMGTIVKGKMSSSTKEVNLDLAKKKVWLVKVRALEYQVTMHFDF